MAFGFITRLFSSSKSSSTPKQTNAKTTATLSESKAAVSITSELENSPINFLTLATSFNDYLLGEQKFQNIETPNKLELSIISNLESMLQGEIPDSAVPRLPEVAMALLQELTDVNISSETLMSYINRDPALASEVLSMSNSALFRGNTEGKIINLEKALVLLGLNNLKIIVSSALMKRLLVISPVYFRMFGQQLWQHSLDCGQACRSLAKQYGECDTHNAYLVGLMHDVGKLAIFGLLTKALGQHLDYQPRGSVFSSIVRDNSLALSVKIAQKWNLPDYLLTALQEQLNTDAWQNASIYGFILYQANILSEFKAVAEKAVKNGQDFSSLLLEYSIPLHLFMEVFPDEYIMLSRNISDGVQPPIE
jgi:HD-like signal output (HDOD) protein